MTPKQGAAPFARKRFGQHFLEPAWVDKLVRAIDPQPDDTFIEIGPGRGALTRPLAARAQHVVGYEIDRDLAGALNAAAPANVRIVQGDFLDAEWTDLRAAVSRLQPPALSPDNMHARLRAVGNLPYNVASPILFKLGELFEAGLPLFDATVMLQREVADRLLAVPGTKDYGVLTILIRHAADADRLLNLPAGAFRPAPKVLSSVVRLRFHAPHPPVRNRAQFAALVQSVFTHRRKTIANALHAYLRTERPALPEWLDGRRRPETLSVDEFARLSDAFFE